MKLKEFIRYDKGGKAISGSLRYSRNKPKNGNWQEIIPPKCCGIDGEWFFLDEYTAPFEQGLLDFPDHFNMESSTNPNLVGVIDDTAVMLYINVTDSAGNFVSFLAGIVLPLCCLSAFKLQK